MRRFRGAPTLKGPDLPRLIIHVGLPKTGSTSIQHMLTTCFAATTQAQQFYYPAHYFQHDKEQHSRVRDYCTNREARKLNKFIYHSLCGAQEKGADTVIWSGENISTMPLDDIVWLRNQIETDFDEIVIVALHREIFTWFRSITGQHLRSTSYFVTVRELARRMRQFDVLQLQSAWQTGMAPHAVHFLELSERDDAVRRFFDFVGAERALDGREIVRKNEKMDFTTSYLLNAINIDIAMPSGWLMQEYRSAFGSTPAPLASEAIFLQDMFRLLPPELRERVEASPNWIAFRDADRISPDDSLEYLEGLAKFLTTLGRKKRAQLNRMRAEHKGETMAVDPAHVSGNALGLDDEPTTADAQADDDAAATRASAPCAPLRDVDP